MDSKIIDILFDYEYEVALPKTLAGHLIPSLKHEILNDLAMKLDCHALSSRRFLRQSQSGLLGFLSADGSDVVNDEKSKPFLFFSPLVFNALTTCFIFRRSVFQITLG